MQQEDDSGDEFSDVDEELEASDVDDEAPSSDDDDAGEYAAALAELGAARRKAGVDGDDDGIGLGIRFRVGERRGTKVLRRRDAKVWGAVGGGG